MYTVTTASGQRHRCAGRRRSPGALLLGCCLAWGPVCGVAHAHGDETHAPPRVYDASKVVQTVFGREGDPTRVVHTVRMTMSDTMRFTPAEVTVQRGQTVRFVVHNGGRQLHEMVLGTADALRRHAEMMRRFPGMEHSDPSMVHVRPGASGEIVWQFTQPGAFQFACLQPGHYEAGMVGTVQVK